MRGMGQGSRAVTVASTAAGSTATPITAPSRLLGWSLAPVDAAGLNVSGFVTAPAAGAVIAQLTAVPAGSYLVNWQIEFSGTLGSAEQDNMGLYVGGTLVAQSSNRQAANEFTQNPIQIVVPAGGANVTVQAINLSTATATYFAGITLTSGPFAECEILDGGQVLAVVAMPQGESDTEILTDDGVYVSGAITVKVTAGTIFGVLYVKDNPEPT